MPNSRKLIIILTVFFQISNIFCRSAGSVLDLSRSSICSLDGMMMDGYYAKYCSKTRSSKNFLSSLCDSIDLTLKEICLIPKASINSNFLKEVLKNTSWSCEIDMKRIKTIQSSFRIFAMRKEICDLLCDNEMLPGFRHLCRLYVSLEKYHSRIKSKGSFDRGDLPKNEDHAIKVGHHEGDNQSLEGGKSGDSGRKNGHERIDLESRHKALRTNEPVNTDISNFHAVSNKPSKRVIKKSNRPSKVLPMANENNDLNGQDARSRESDLDPGSGSIQRKTSSKADSDFEKSISVERKKKPSVSFRKDDLNAISPNSTGGRKPRTKGKNEDLGKTGSDKDENAAVPMNSKIGQPGSVLGSKLNTKKTPPASSDDKSLNASKSNITSGSSVRGNNYLTANGTKMKSSTQMQNALIKNESSLINSVLKNDKGQVKSGGKTAKLSVDSSKTASATSERVAAKSDVMHYEKMNSSSSAGSDENAGKLDKSGDSIKLSKNVKGKDTVSGLIDHREKKTKSDRYTSGSAKKKNQSLLLNTSKTKNKKDDLDDRDEDEADGDNKPKTKTEVSKNSEDDDTSDEPDKDRPSDKTLGGIVSNRDGRGRLTDGNISTRVESKAAGKGNGAVGSGKGKKLSSRSDSVLDTSSKSKPAYTGRRGSITDKSGKASLSGEPAGQVSASQGLKSGGLRKSAPIARTNDELLSNRESMRTVDTAAKTKNDRMLEERRRERLRKMKIYSDDDDQSVKSSHFIVYGTIGLILMIVLYIVYQKRQKILALIVEGRRQRGISGSGERSRRGSGNVAYKPLSTKEEPLDERPESIQKYIY